MKTRLLILATAMSLAAINPILAEEKSAKGGFQIGVLTCTSDPETQKNLIVSSSVKVDCELKYNNGNVDHYTG